MIDCENVDEVQSFVVPGQHIDRSHFDHLQHDQMRLSDILTRCYGAVVVSPGTDKSAAVDQELVNRLSYNWLSQHPVPRKRLAFIGGASLKKFEGYSIAAASLNIAVVVFDEPGHWQSSGECTRLREQFVPMDMTPDDSMPARIAEQVSEIEEITGQKFDGVMTVDEHLLTIVSRAATLLGLPTSPPESVALAQNKFQTRQLDTNVYCRLLRSPSDLEALLREDGSHLQYPLIVKPARGWSSEGVWKVATEQELQQKVPMLWQDAFTTWHGRDVVVETYVDGPEVDANMVLVNGEVVFFEVNDDFPSPGDYGSQDKDRSAPVANFVETSNMIPSALPSSELAALRRRLHHLALAAGFRDGILHMEARLRNSSCHFARPSDTTGQPDGLVDLCPNTDTTSVFKPEDVFLLEINPRQPGWQEIEATAHAYGVSYYSLAVVNALADSERIVALSQPFLGGAQYHMQLLFVSARRGGVYHHGDVCAAVLSSRHDLRSHVVACASLIDEGQEVPDPRTGMVYGNFIAYFLIVSRDSRQEAMRIGEEVERLVRVHTDDF